MIRTSPMSTFEQLKPLLLSFRSNLTDSATAGFNTYRFLIPTLKRMNTIADRMQILRDQGYGYLWVKNPVIKKQETHNMETLIQPKPDLPTYQLFLEWKDGSDCRLLISNKCTTEFKLENESPTDRTI